MIPFYFTVLIIWILLCEGQGKDERWLGCYRDDPKDRLLYPLHSPYNPTKDNSVEMCISACRKESYTYAGLISSNICLCGNNHDYNKYGKLNAKECNMPCPGDQNQTCGAKWTLEIYSVCHRGYYDRGSQPCVNKCHCDVSQICSRNGTCPYRCDDGWQGSKCQFIDCSYGNGGCEQECENLRITDWCSCYEGYKINDTNWTRCDDVDECAVNAGGCEHECNNTDGSYVCSCRSGFIMSSNGRSCDDIVECDVGNGGCEGQCTNTNGSYFCSCPVGYFLSPNGYSCQDIVECDVDNGGCEGQCTNTNGSYFCSCPAGYSLSPNGYSCQDIDECGQKDNGDCQHMCHNFVGSYNCSCDSGFSLSKDDHKMCSDADECNVNNGGCSDVCLNTLGSYECACHDGREFANGSRLLCTVVERQKGNRIVVRAGVVSAFTLIVILALFVVLFLIKHRKRKSEVYNGIDNNHVISDTSFAENIIVTSDSVQINMFTEEHETVSAPANYNNDVVATNDDQLDGENTYSNADQIPSRMLTLTELVKEAAEIVNDPTRVKAEYESIPKKIGSVTVASNPSVKSKNRFKDIIPYDYNRVQLATLEGYPHSDYINASYIKGYGGRQIIASQGPTKETLNDFWKMLWEKEVEVVVMVTNSVENGKENCHVQRKCEVYWGQNEDLSCNDLVIHLESEQKLLDYTIRTLTVMKNDSSQTARSIEHFHYTTWPDHGVPSHGAALLRFCRRALHSKEDCPSTVIHCSAGVGRTGTLLAIDWLMQEAKETNTVDIPHYVYQLRTQRMNTVQTEEQYRFLYHSLAEGTCLGNTALSVVDIQAFAADPQYNDIVIAQFQELKRRVKILAAEDTTHALKDKNRMKNRGSIFPADKHRVKLMSHYAGHTDYINAVFVPGYLQSNEYIATQWPTEDTATDFWRMVSDYKVTSVVLLDSVDEQNGYLNFLPEIDRQIDFDKMAVFTEKNVRNTHYVKGSVTVKTEPLPSKQTEYSDVTELAEDIYVNTAQVTNRDYSTSHEVNIWCLRDNGDCQYDSEPLSALYHDVIKSDNTASGKPVVVVCKDGCRGCGLFIAMSTLNKMLHTEGEFDAFYVVQYLKTVQPELFSSQEQYLYLHEVMFRSTPTSRDT